jgi:hypothetical protein
MDIKKVISRLVIIFFEFFILIHITRQCVLTHVLTGIYDTHMYISLMHKKMDPMIKDLMDVFYKYHATMSNDAMTIGVVTFAQLALTKAGHPRHRIMATGYLGEAVCAAELGAKINEKAQGPDAVDKAGKTFEMKITHAALGSMANVNVRGSVVKSGETRSAYYARLATEIMDKGPMRIEHVYDMDPETGAVKKNVYTLSPGFVVCVMDSQNSWKKQNTQFGARSCTTCTKVHKLVRFEELSRMYDKDPLAFDIGLLASPGTATCPCTSK